MGEKRKMELRGGDKLFRIHRTVIRMMRDRGYIIPPEFDREVMTKDVFMQRYAGNDQGEVQREQLKMRFVHQTERHKILVLFEKNPKVGKKEIERLCERMGEDKRCVMILDGAMSPPARIQVENMAPEVLIEVFPEDQLLVNITEHRLVPHHQPLTQAQKEAVLARYKVKDSQLPRMQLTDPTARYFGLQRGDVVKITRSSETAGLYTTYRTVI